VKITHHFLVDRSAEHSCQWYSTQKHAAYRPDKYSQAIPYQPSHIESYLKLMVRLVKCQNSRERDKSREVGKVATWRCRGHHAQEPVCHWKYFIISKLDGLCVRVSFRRCPNDQLAVADPHTRARTKVRKGTRQSRGWVTHR
jgi:hypothetical protein